MTASHLPAGLYTHPAWIAWKETQGWKRLDAEPGLRILIRPLGAGASMAYCPFPSADASMRDEPVYERGAALERFAWRMLPRLPNDCAFIRMDLMLEAWTDSNGAMLDVRLQELRMNASTAWRSLRKAPAETVCTSTILVGLDEPGAMLARMDARTRYSLRLAERRGTAVRRVGEEGLGIFHRLHAETAIRQCLEIHPAATFRHLFSSARSHDLDLELYLAEYDGKPAAAAIVARHREDAWYLFAASSGEHRAAAGPSAILHRAMRDLTAAGARRLDLLGAAPPGEPSHPLARLSAFKAGFGGRLVSRAGAWDLVLHPQHYARHVREESLRLVYSGSSHLRSQRAAGSMPPGYSQY